MSAVGGATQDGSRRRSRALVTGGASGIGAATAELLRRRGLQVTIADVREDPGREVAAGIGAEFVALDVADPDAWSGLLDSFDVLHLNAGIAFTESDLAAVSDEAYERVMAVNAGGAFFGLREAARAWAGSGGDVVITASAAIVLPPADNIAYSMSKYAVIGLLRSVAPALSRSGIRVNAVCPGLVRTPLVPKDMLTRYRMAGVPVIEPEAVASVVVDLVFGDATGQSWLVVEGIEPRPFEIASVEP